MVLLASVVAHRMDRQSGYGCMESRDLLPVVGTKVVLVPAPACRYFEAEGGSEKGGKECSTYR